MKPLALVVAAMAAIGPAVLAGPALASLPTSPRGITGDTVLPRDVSISQMEDNTPAYGTGISCVGETTTWASSWWRRFYFSEHGAPAGSVEVRSVTLSVERGLPTPIAVRLYSIPHDVPVDTIPLAGLTPIGAGSGVSDGTERQTLTIPVSGVVADAVNTDLVVEYHIDDSVGLFVQGANMTEQTHPSFFSWPECGIDEPTALRSPTIGGTLMTVGLGTMGPAAPNVSMAFSPESTMVATTSTLTIALDNRSQPTAATLGADFIHTLPEGLRVATAPNATTTCVNGSVATSASADAVVLNHGAQIPAAGFCTLSVDVVAAAPGLFRNRVAAGALQTDLGVSHAPAKATLTVYSGSSTTFPPFEDFDHAPPPALPTGWISSTVTGTSDWVTTSSAQDAGPNAVYVGERGEVSDFTLDSPVFVPVPNQNVSFRHRYALVSPDAAVLEISIDGGDFVDILQAGGIFVTGGYNDRVFRNTGSPLAGRAAWLFGTPDSTFMTTIASLPAEAVGKPTRLRFRTADDEYGAAWEERGWWIDSIRLGVGVPPAATIAPQALNFTVAADASASQTLSIANAAGSDPLLYSVIARGTSSMLQPPLSVPLADTQRAAPPAGAEPSFRVQPLTQPTLASTPPWIAPGTLVFQLDDGAPETAVGFGEPGTERGSIYLNRYSVDGPVTIDSISVFWGDEKMGNGDLRGLQANLVVYYDADGGPFLRNAKRIGTNHLVDIAVTGGFQTYATDFRVPGPGHVYVGFVDQWALGGGFTPPYTPAAFDVTVPQGQSYFSAHYTQPTDLDNLDNNTITENIDWLFRPRGNFAIRATATDGNGPCQGSVPAWLVHPPSNGVVDGGTQHELAVTAVPALAGLGQGTYTASLCLTTNDPSQPVVSVPVNLTVTAAASACRGGADAIFCDGFEAPDTASEAQH